MVRDGLYVNSSVAPSQGHFNVSRSEYRVCRASGSKSTCDIRMDTLSDARAQGSARLALQPLRRSRRRRLEIGGAIAALPGRYLVAALRRVAGRATVHAICRQKMFSPSQLPYFCVDTVISRHVLEQLARRYSLQRR